MTATRRNVLAGAAAALALPARAQAPKSRLILLGTGGGPTPKPNRAEPAQVIVVNGAAYVIDCGNGVARQMVLAGVPLASIRNVFLTHQHSDHNADYGNLLLLAWAVYLSALAPFAGPVIFVLYITRFQIEPEERVLKTIFGEEYSSYAARVRRWL